MKWTQDKVAEVGRLKNIGWANREIARHLGVTTGIIEAVVHKNRFILPDGLRGRIKGKNTTRTWRAKLDKRIWELGDKFGNTPEMGWLVGHLRLGAKCRAKGLIRLSTSDTQLQKTFINILRKVTQNKIETEFNENFGYRATRIRVRDAALADFLLLQERRILSGWRPIHIRDTQLEFWRGVLEGVFKARARYSKGMRREKAVRLYTTALPAGAVRAIRTALKRFGIKYSMQGGLSDGERKDYKRINRSLLKLKKSGYPQSKGLKLIKKLIPKDVAKRRTLHSPPSIKIRPNPANLKRFSEIVKFVIA